MFVLSGPRLQSSQPVTHGRLGSFEPGTYPPWKDIGKVSELSPWYM